MKTERNILVAFLLNLFFSVFELIGGFLTGSIAIVSDAVHDLGDALSIGLAYLLEKKSKKQPDTNYTYGYARYSVLGALITSTILIVGSVFVIFNAVNRIINPVEIRYNGMIIFAIIGASVNFLAAYFTREGDSMNQKAVNLHMLEDVLGWVIVLIGAITMKFTDFRFIDSVLSIGVALFILVNALKSYKSILDLFLEKTPDGVDVEKIRNILMNVSGVNDVHHIHIWSLDGVNNYATLHVVTNSDDIAVVKRRVKNRLRDFGINHVTLEFETDAEECFEKECRVDVMINTHCHHGHHHHGHQHQGLPSFHMGSDCCCETTNSGRQNWEKSGSDKFKKYDPLASKKKK